jgi:hypothetical protein
LGGCQTARIPIYSEESSIRLENFFRFSSRYLAKFKRARGVSSIALGEFQKIHTHTMRYKHLANAKF